jgi:glycogen(starch) synthase
MHVLITADTVGGVWVYVRELVNGLVRRGVGVTLVSFGEIPDHSQAAWLSSLPGVDFRPTSFKLEWMQDSAADLEQSSKYLCEVVREVNPELLHLNQYCYGSLPVSVPRVVVGHSDVVSWWATVHGGPPPENDWIRGYRKRVTRGLLSATAVVAPSRWMLDQLATHYVWPERGSVIYNGRSPAAFDRHRRKENFMMSVGRFWDSAKQVNLLAECRLPLRTIIAGADVHPDPAFRAAHPGPRRPNKVEFIGPQSPEALSELFSRASIYAATSRYEPFGLAPLEAALSGCAIIANDIPSFREIWGDSVCYFERNDARSLAAAVDRLHRDPALRDDYASRAWERASARFSADRMVDEYLTLYRTLTSTRVAA